MNYKEHFVQQKEQLVEMSLKLFREGLIVGTWGNLSMRVKNSEEEVFLVTPSGMDYERTEVEDILVVDEKGNVIEGKRKPSTELKMHLEIYKNRKDINAVFHTHSTFATACAVSGQEIPMMVEDMIQHIGGEVPVAQYALPGTEELARYVAKVLSNRNGALLKNHGAIGIGPTAEEAYKSCILIEKSAKIYIHARMLGNVNLLSKEDAEVMVQYYNEKYGQK